MRNYTKKKEDIHYALLRLITGNYTQSKFEKKNIFLNLLSRNYALLFFGYSLKIPIFRI
jgi:hypothetical protein